MSNIKTMAMEIAEVMSGWTIECDVSTRRDTEESSYFDCLAAKVEAYLNRAYDQGFQDAAGEKKPAERKGL